MKYPSCFTKLWFLLCQLVKDCNLKGLRHKVAKMGIEKLNLSRVIYRVDMKMERKTFFFIYFWKLYYLEDEDWALSCTQKLRSNLEKCIFYEYNFRKKKMCLFIKLRDDVYLYFVFIFYSYLFMKASGWREDREAFLFLVSTLQANMFKYTSSNISIVFQIKKHIYFYEKKIKF